MIRQLSRLLWWMILGALLGGLSAALDGLLLGLVGGTLFEEEPVRAGLFLGGLLGIIGACAGALIGAGACYILPRLVLQPPAEKRQESPRLNQ